MVKLQILLPFLIMFALLIALIYWARKATRNINLNPKKIKMSERKRVENMLKI